MKTTITIQLAGFTCQFVDFGNQSGYDNWKWKLDPYLCPADAQPLLQIDSLCNKGHDSQLPDNMELLKETPAGFYSHKVYQQGDRLIWTYEDAKSHKRELAYDFSLKENRITLLEDHTNSARTLALEYLGNLMVPFLLKEGIMTFHAVLMEYKGEGIIISADSGTGKTTHARLWRDTKNALIINGDRATVRKEADEYMAYGLPWSGTSGEQVNRRVPLKALVILERGPVNNAQVMTGFDAFELAMPHLQVPAWELSLSEKGIDLLLELLEQIPVIRLQCRPDEEAVETLAHALQLL